MPLEWKSFHEWFSLNRNAYYKHNKIAGDKVATTKETPDAVEIIVLPFLFHHLGVTSGLRRS